MKIKIGVNNTWLYFMILFYILSSYSVYMVLLVDGTIVQLLALLLSVFTVIMLLRHSAISKKIILMPLVATAVFCASTFFSTNDIVTTLLYFLRFSCVFWVVALYMKQGKDLLQVIYKCVLILAIFYFVCYLIFDVASPDLGLQAIRDVGVDVTGKTYVRLFHNHYNIYIRWATSYDLFGLTIDRLSGFCWEAGQYQIYLNFALMYLLFFENNQKRHLKEIVFFCLNVVLTASAMGILIMVVLFMIKLLGMKNGMMKVLLFVPLIGAGIVFIVQLLVEKSVNSEYSYTSRMGEFSLLSNVLLKNNIFGQAEFTTNVANAIIRFFWTYGYLAVIVVFILAFMILSKKGMYDSFEKKSSFGMWLLLSLFNEPIEFFNFTFLIVSIIIVGYMYKNRNKKMGDRNEKYVVNHSYTNI